MKSLISSILAIAAAHSVNGQFAVPIPKGINDPNAVCVDVLKALSDRSASVLNRGSKFLKVRGLDGFTLSCESASGVHVPFGIPDDDELQTTPKVCFAQDKKCLSKKVRAALPKRRQKGPVMIVSQDCQALVLRSGLTREITFPKKGISLGVLFNKKEAVNPNRVALRTTDGKIRRKEISAPAGERAMLRTFGPTKDFAVFVDDVSGKKKKDAYVIYRMNICISNFLNQSIAKPISETIEPRIRGKKGKKDKSKGKDKKKAKKSTDKSFEELQKQLEKASKGSLKEKKSKKSKKGKK